MSDRDTPVTALREAAEAISTFCNCGPDIVQDHEDICIQSEPKMKALIAALASSDDVAGSGERHPHDGYAYESCVCVCCVNVRALGTEDWRKAILDEAGVQSVGQLFDPSDDPDDVAGSGERPAHCDLCSHCRKYGCNCVAPTTEALPKDARPWVLHEEVPGIFVERAVPEGQTGDD
jgi:hypothetical protein